MTNCLSDCKEVKQPELTESVPTIRIAFLDVGQGDTIVVSCPSSHEAIVVDCTDANSVLDYLEQEQIVYLRSVIITHLHEDHYTEVVTLLKNYDSVPGMHACEVLAFNQINNRSNRRMLMQDADGHSTSNEEPLRKGKRKPAVTPYSSLIGWLDQQKDRSLCASIHVQRGDLPPRNTLANILNLEGVLAHNVFLTHPYFMDLPSLESQCLNNTSVVLHIIGPGSSALLTGDLEPAGWQQLLKNHPDLHSDVLKFPHHGGAWQAVDADNLLNTVQPSAVVISVGTEGEKYKHPHKDVFAALAAHPHIRVLCTQATSQCQTSVRDKQGFVIRQLDVQASNNNRLRIGSKGGCPCAGTVIIELGDKMGVLQPSVNVHHDLIIIPHFLEHQCVIEHTKQPVGVVKEAQAAYIHNT